jgi:hypothetical protein
MAAVKTGFTQREQAIVKILGTLQSSSLSDEEVDLFAMSLEGLFHEKSITGLSSKIVVKDMSLVIERSFDDGFVTEIVMTALQRSKGK